MSGLCLFGLGIFDFLHLLFANFVCLLFGAWAGNIIISCLQTAAAGIRFDKSGENELYHGP